MKSNSPFISAAHLIILCCKGAAVGTGARIILGVIIPSSFENAVSVLLCVLCFAAGFALAKWMDISRAARVSYQFE